MKCHKNIMWSCYSCERLFCWDCNRLVAESEDAALDEAGEEHDVTIKTAVRQCASCKQGSSPVPPVAPTT
jgi:hypothetical protein